ncbi:M4 family metallopeptidase [Pendulispora rubella]|uniref:Neutral metalloproteinase n=1 Tax=Pendulispora rubella TaxID=2741070 RepID=A0ABZ2LB46_9BACT
MKSILNRRPAFGSWATLVALPILACAPVACSGNSSESSDTPEPSTTRMQIVSTEKLSGIPTYVKGQLGAAASKSALASIASALHASGSELVLKNTLQDESGAVHERYTQLKNGYEIVGGELVVHSRQGVIYAANGNARSNLSAPTEAAAKVSAAAAAVRALSAYDLGDFASADPNTQLVYRRTVNGTGDALELLHRVTVKGTQADGTPILDKVLVNAVDGSVVARLPTIHTAKNRELHDLKNKTTLPGTTVRTEGQAATSDAVVNNNYDRLGTTYDAYKELFNRDSLDGSGGKLISSVHYSTKYNNAYWNGTQMVYGDGDGSTFSNLANSLDVTAHELTHGVTSNTSNLEYSGESGGLNEAMSDIFGNVVEYYGAGKVVSDNTWKVGEDVYTPNTAGDALRYMNDPAKDGDSLDYYPDYTSGVDVHYSSGIANLAFYLLSQGGKHPRSKTTVSVTAIGIEKAAQIFYRANTQIFTASTTFAQAKQWTGQAAQDLGYTQAEISAVADAWSAVGVTE